MMSLPAGETDYLGSTLRELLTHFHPGVVRTWIESLSACETNKEVAETAKLYLFVLEALAASEQKSAPDRGKGPAARLRRALGRVPPELRKTVEEIAEKIRAKRRAQSALTAKGRRKGH